MCSFCRWSVFSSSKKPQASRPHCTSWCFKTLHFLSSLGEVSSISTCYFFLLLPQDLLFILLILHAFSLSPLTCHMPCKTHRTWFRQHNIFCPSTFPSVECHSVQFFSIKVSYIINQHSSLRNALHLLLLYNISNLLLSCWSQ